MAQMSLLSGTDPGEERPDQSVHISVGAATQRSKAALPVYTPQPRQHVALPGLILSVTLVGCVLVHCH